MKHQCTCCENFHENEFSLTCEECDSERESGNMPEIESLAES